MSNCYSIRPRIEVNIALVEKFVNQNESRLFTVMCCVIRCGYTFLMHCFHDTCLGLYSEKI